MRVFNRLQERYPDIAFYLALQPEEATEPQEFDLPQIEGQELIYFFGTDRGEAFSQLLPWLEKKTEQRLVFLEDNWGRLTSFLKSPHAEAMIEHPQVHLKYIPHLAGWSAALEEVAEQFPSDKILCVPLKGQRSAQFARRRLKLMRSSSALSALYSDVLYSHKLFANFYVNFPKLLKGFDANCWENAFSEVPAIICGAGPSLAKSLPYLKGENALIIAGGSAIPALLHAGIQPHLAMALDPNEEELQRLRDLSGLRAPLLCSPRLQRAVLDTFQGDVGYLYSGTGGLSEEWLRQRLGMPGHVPIGDTLGREAFSVTTLALAYAHFLGCNPIILAGVDLAYTGGKRYAPGISASPEAMSHSILEKKMHRKDSAGRRVQTLLKWVMEADALYGFAKRHPDRRYINLSRDGLPIKRFEEASLELAPLQIDLRTHVQSQIQKTRFDLKADWPQLCDALKDSLLRCGEVSRLMQQQPSMGKKTRLLLELSEESAYPCFLEGVEAALERVLMRYIPEGDQQREKAKWQEISAACDRFTEILRIR